MLLLNFGWEEGDGETLRVWSPCHVVSVVINYLTATLDLPFS